MLPLVFLVPDFWLPEFDLVALGIHDPGEHPIFVVLRALYYIDPRGGQLLDHRLLVFDAVFFDAGRTWGSNPVGSENLGLLWPGSVA